MYNDLKTKIEKGEPIADFFAHLSPEEVKKVLSYEFPFQFGSLDSNTDYLTVVHLAAQSGNLPALKTLSEYGADFSVLSGNYQESALHWAAEYNHPEVIEYLIREKKLDPNFPCMIKKYSFENRTPLFNCAVKSCTGAAKKLIELGADVNYRTNKGNTALHAACFYGFMWEDSSKVLEFIELLLKNNVDISLPGNILYFTKVTADFMVAEPENSEAVEKLIDQYKKPPKVSSISIFKEVFSITNEEKLTKQQITDLKLLYVVKSEAHFKKMQERLIEAICKNSIDEVTACLKKGGCLKVDDLQNLLPSSMKPHNANLEIINLLEDYHALPPNTSAATLKFILYLEGNDQIQFKDFFNQPTLNLNGCPGLQSPMQIAVRRGYEDGVRFLIDSGVQERPLSFLFLGIHKGYFSVGDILLNPNEFKEKIAALFNGEISVLPKIIESQCRIAELLITHPTGKLDSEIDELPTEHDELRFLPFFVWIVKNNKYELLDSEYFQKLLTRFPKAVVESIKAATFYGSKEYVKGTFTHLPKSEISTLLSIACITFNQEMLICITEELKKLGLSLSYESLFDHDECAEDPLTWALANDNIEAIRYLLQNGYSPNYNPSNLHHLMSGKGQLHDAVSRGRLDVVKMLVSYNAEVKHKDNRQKTPLHLACILKHWEIASLLINEYNADIYATDEAKKTPLDYIEDAEIRAKICPNVSSKKCEPGLLSALGHFNTSHIPKLSGIEDELELLSTEIRKN